MAKSPCCEVAGFDASIGRCRPCKDLHVERIDVCCLQPLPVAAKFAQIHDGELTLLGTFFDDVFGPIDTILGVSSIEHIL